MKMGSKIKMIREMRDFTQSYMAMKLDMSQSNYSKIEHNESKIDIERLEQIAVILEVDIHFIMDFEPDKFLPPLIKKK